ncbi:hypothetical protein C8R47DRAFT_618321 [Mycena vitilis]|nr:hypothetical protein C8R47DRAFT_618321 [Mycena vitilis]
MNASSAHIARFPPELVDMIIRENAKDGPTLRSSALVCGAFLQPSQACIFSQVRLTPHGDNRAQQLHNSLMDSPHLRSYIKGLQVYDAGVGHSPQASCCQSFVPVLELLDGVTAFTLYFGVHGTVEWDALPRELRTAICSLCQRSTLTSLRLINPRNVAQADFARLVASPVLRKLWLWDVDVPSLTDVDLPSMNKHLRLADCCFHLNVPTLEILTRWLVRGDSLSDVACLRFTWKLETSCQFRDIIKASASNLRELYFDSQLFDSPPSLIDVELAKSISFSALKNLRHLTLSFNVEDDCRRLVEFFARLLETCSDGLKKLQFSPAVVMNFPDVTVDWTPVAKILTAARFPALSNVTFSLLSLAPPTDVHEKRFMEDTRCAFPALAERGILDVRRALDHTSLRKDLS